MNRREKTDKIIVHCAYTHEGMDIGVAEIREWHTSPPRNWSDIAYHAVIRRDGTVEQGREIDMQGAHTYGQNESSVGVCLAGGRDKEGRAVYNFTNAQMHSLTVWVSGMLRKYPLATVHGHSEFASKTCPNFDVKIWASENLF